jgi:oligopeptide transport system permease protein
MNYFDNKLFIPIDLSRKEMVSQETKTIAFWNDVWTRFRKNIPALIGLIIILLLLFFAIFGPFMLP